MPISRGEFQHRRIDLTFPIADVLVGFPSLAFTVDEVKQLLINTSARDAPLEQVKEALEALVLQGRVEMAEIEGLRWYTIVVRRLGFPGERR